MFNLGEKEDKNLKFQHGVEKVKNLNRILSKQVSGEVEISTPKSQGTNKSSSFSD